METNEAVEKLRQFVIEYGLPKTEMALFGVKCPYCGKSDRIRRLENPNELRGEISSEDVKQYAKFWQSLTQSKRFLGVCKFCQNPLKISKEGRSEALYK